ncbi:procollagen-proline 4-dioxygenase [Trifolium repens]|nr:procollagen-proline 4-dioxygenase [Trifolium repens]
MDWPFSSVQEPSSHSRTQIALLKLNPLSVQLSSAVVSILYLCSKSSLENSDIRKSILSVGTNSMKHSSYAGSASAIIDPTRVKQASWKPRAIVYQGFLADLECDHLISIAKSELKGSAVADNFSVISGETNFQVTTIPILEISRNTLLNLRVLRWGKNNTMDTLRRKTSTTMKIGSTLSLLGSIPIEGDQKHQHTEYGHLSPHLSPLTILNLLNFDQYVVT